MIKPENMNLDKNKYYFLCAAGIGDTMIVCGFYNALKNKYNSEITLLIPEKQEFIVKMFGITDYKIVNLGYKNIQQVIKKYTKLSNKCPEPQKGKVYLAHWIFHNEMQDLIIPIYYRKSKQPFLDIYKKFLGLDLKTPFENIINIPKLSNKVEKQLLQLGDIENIVILSPEATSTPKLNNKFWEKLAIELNKKGHIVISNVINEKNKIKNTHYLKLSLKDSIALAYKCHSVYSVRSGFCDLCYQLNEKLNVYYTDRDSLFLYSLNTMFEECKINEILEFNLPEKLQYSTQFSNLRNLKHYFIPRFILDIFNIPRDIIRFIKKILRGT